MATFCSSGIHSSVKPSQWSLCALHTTATYSLLFGKLFDSIILLTIFFLYFASLDIISLKICLKFMVVGWSLIKTCQCDGSCHSEDMQEDYNLPFWKKKKRKKRIQCPKHRPWVINNKQKRMVKGFFKGPNSDLSSKMLLQECIFKSSQETGRKKKELESLGNRRMLETKSRENGWKSL